LSCAFEYRAGASERRARRRRPWRRFGGRLSFLLSVWLVVAACSGVQFDPPTDQPQELSNHYVLGAGDQVRVLVFGQEELSGEFSVNADGSVALPLVGAVAAAGKTPNALESDIAMALSPDYVRDPQVSVEVLRYRPYFIMGEVKAPGSYPYMSGLDVQSAVAVAGGYTYRAKKTFVLLTRSAGGRKERREVQPDTPILPGDVIEVPERFF